MSAPSDRNDADHDNGFAGTYQPSLPHLELGDAFYDEVAAAVFPQHDLRYRNNRSAATVGLDRLTDGDWVAHFGRFKPLPGNLQTALALRYHGHQFRAYNPNLGDGRGFLFAQLRERDSGRLLDLATKGSGQTPWARGRDGRLTLKGGVREILAAEMLEALGVDTSKVLSLIETGEDLVRNDEPSPTRSSVLVRLSHSHIRIGTFERLAYFGERENIERLIDHCIRYYYPELESERGPARVIALFAAVSRAVAQTGARWLAAGFAHGVLNTDNINITGESFDYGPWRFVPTFDLRFTAAYFDRNGLYSFGQQPTALEWNIVRLGDCLLPFAEASALASAQKVFSPSLQQEFARALLARFGLKREGEVRDDTLVRAIFAFLTTSGAPLEQVFFDWFNGEASAHRARQSPVAGLYETEPFIAIRRAWDGCEMMDSRALDMTYFQRRRPCTMLIDEVEALWQAIVEGDDWQPFHEKLAEIREMAAAYRLERPTS